MSPEKSIKHLTLQLQSEQVLHSLAKKQVKVLTFRCAKMIQLLRRMEDAGRLTDDERQAFDLLFIEDGTE
jgi:DNA replication protein DnaC